MDSPSGQLSNQIGEDEYPFNSIVVGTACESFPFKMTSLEEDGPDYGYTFSMHRVVIFFLHVNHLRLIS